MSFKNISFCLVMLLFAVLALALTSCPKGHPNLAHYDEFGHLTAEIDGEHWYPEEYYRFLYPNASHGANIRYNNPKKSMKKNSGIILNEDGSYKVQIWGDNYYDDIGFSFTAVNITGPGIYPISDCHLYTKKDDYMEMIEDYSSVEFDEVEIDTMMFYDPNSEEWHVEISDSSYVSGAFQFRCTNGEETVRVTNGKFRLENKSYNNY